MGSDVKFFSTMMTVAPASRAATAAGIPAAPEPMTTMSASRSHLMAASADSAPEAASAAPPSQALLPLFRKLRLLTVGCFVWRRRFISCHIVSSSRIRH